MIDAGQACGVEVSARQLERWRQLGAIPHAPPQWLGRGRGSTSEYSTEQIDYIVEYARRAGPKRRPDQITIWMFLDGIDVTEERLRPALVRELQLYLTQILRLACTEDLFDAPDPLVSLLRRGRSAQALQRRRRFRGTYETMVSEGTLHPDEDPATGVLINPTFAQFDERSVMTILDAALAGEEPTPDALFELATDQVRHLERHGISADADEDFVSRFGEEIGKASYSDYISMASEIPYAILVGAAAELRAHPSIAAILGMKFGRPPEPEDVIAPLGMAVILRGMLSAQLDRDLSWDDMIEIALADESPGQSTFPDDGGESPPS